MGRPLSNRFTHKNNIQAMLFYQQVSEKCSKSDNLVYEGGLLWDKLVDASVEVPPKTGFHFLYALYTPRHLTHYEQVT